MFKEKKSYKIVSIILALLLLLSTIALFGINKPQRNVTAEPEFANETFDVNGSLYGSGNSLYNPETYIRSRYNVSSLTSENHEIPSWSYMSQSALNQVYNDRNNAHVNGTCGVVACTGVAFYYSTVKGYTNIPSDKDTLFGRLISECYHITGDEGTYSSSYKIVVPWLFEQYGYSIRASRATVMWKYTKMREQVDAHIPTIFCTSGTELYGSHAMVVVGYKKYTFTYDGNKTKTETYYMLDEGWGRNRAAYVLEGDMPGSWEITIFER